MGDPEMGSSEGTHSHFRLPSRPGYPESMHVLLDWEREMKVSQYVGGHRGM